MKITTLTKYAHITHAEAAAAEAEHGRFFRFEVVANDCVGPAWKLVCAEKTWPNGQNPKWESRLVTVGASKTALEKTGSCWVQEQCLGASAEVR